VVTERSIVLLLLPFRGAGLCFGPIDADESGREADIAMLILIDMSSCLISSIGEVGRRV
jgi:hypothetical protein